MDATVSTYFYYATVTTQS